MRVQISASLDSDAPYLPDISAPLRAVAEQVEEELSTCQVGRIWWISVQP